MTKNNKLLIGILTFVVSIMVGYALFSDTITVTGSATATGNFNITPTCSLTTPDIVLNQVNHTEEGYLNPECNVNGNVITSKATLEYPSAFKLFYTEYKNDGDIDAVIKFNYSVPESFVGIQPVVKVYDNKTNQLVETLNKFDDNYVQMEPAKFYVKKANGTYLHTKNELITNDKVYKDTAGDFYIEIKPGETFVFLYRMFWPRNAEVTGRYSTAEMSLELKFIQKTDDLKINTDGTAPEFCYQWC